MKHMNPKLAKLLKEGFSMKTLNKFSEDQISLLYSKLLQEQAKPIEKKVTSTIAELPPNSQYIATKPGTKIENKDGKTIVTQTEGEVTEKSVSKKQHGLMGAAYSVEKGEKELKDIPKTYRKKVKDVVDSMSKKQLKDFAKTSKLPEKVESKKDEVKKLEESIMKLVQNHLPPHTTKSELLEIIKRNKR